MSQTRRTRNYAQSAKRVRIARREERKNYLLPPSHASHSFRASRKMRARLAWHRKRLLCRLACLLFRNTYNGDFGAISVREQSFTAPVLKSGSSICRLSSSQSDRDCSGSKWEGARTGTHCDQALWVKSFRTMMPLFHLCWHSFKKLYSHKKTFIER